MAGHFDPSRSQQECFRTIAHEVSNDDGLLIGAYRQIIQGSCPHQFVAWCCMYS